MGVLREQANDAAIYDMVKGLAHQLCNSRSRDVRKALRLAGREVLTGLETCPNWRYEYEKLFSIDQENTEIDPGHWMLKNSYW